VGPEGETASAGSRRSAVSGSGSPVAPDRKARFVGWVELEPEAQPGPPPAGKTAPRLFANRTPTWSAKEPGLLTHLLGARSPASADRRVPSIQPARMRRHKGRTEDEMGFFSAGEVSTGR
jgi:hypothetical protein